METIRFKGQPDAQTQAAIAEAIANAGKCNIEIDCDLVVVKFTASGNAFTTVSVQRMDNGKEASIMMVDTANPDAMDSACKACMTCLFEREEAWKISLEKAPSNREKFDAEYNEGLSLVAQYAQAGLFIN